MKPWGSPAVNKSAPPQIVKSGDIIRLMHVETKRNIHSHQLPGHVTTSEYEVSGYGNETSGDVSDHWIIEKYDDIAVGNSIDTIRSLTTRFRLRHVLLKCLLYADGTNYPQWGFKQIEVVCHKSAKANSLPVLWNIEHHENDKCKKKVFF